MMEKTNQAILAIVVIVIIAGGAYAFVILPGITPVEEQLKIAVCLPASVNDFAWNYEMYYSATTADQLLDNATIDVFTDLGQDVAAKAVFRELADTGYQILVGHTHEYGAMMQDIADEYPDTLFFSTGIYADNISNTWGYEVALYQIAYVHGLIAANISQTGKLGYMDGFKFDSTNLMANGFYLGALAMNPAVNVSFVYAFTWEDMDLAREQAQALIDTGVDMIQARTSVPGAIQAAAQNDSVYLFGAVADQSSLAPTSVISSMCRNSTTYLLLWAELFWSDGFVHDELYILDWAQDGGYMALNPTIWNNDTIISPGLRTLVDDTIEDIFDGTLVVPYNGTPMWE